MGEREKNTRVRILDGEVGYNSLRLPFKGDLSASPSKYALITSVYVRRYIPIPQCDGVERQMTSRYSEELGENVRRIKPCIEKLLGNAVHMKQVAMQKWLKARRRTAKGRKQMSVVSGREGRCKVDGGNAA
jgi:hypothetical protein